MTNWPFSPPLSPMEAAVHTALPEPPGWAYEPKWDGFRCLAWAGSDPRLDRRTKPVLRYFPELRAAFDHLPDGTVVDCAIVIVRDGKADADALSGRIHPAASRIAVLAEATPAELVAFDLLAVDGEDLRKAPYAERRAHLERLCAAAEPPWHLSPSTTDVETAGRWLTDFAAAGCDGIVAKPLDQGYSEGELTMISVQPAGGGQERPNSPTFAEIVAR